MYRNPYIKIQPDITRPITEIWLIRHCHPNYSLADKLGDKNMPLSKRGLEQRDYLTGRLMHAKINVVYTSELKRAQETANDFAEKINKKPIINRRLNEYHWEHWHKIKYFNMSEREREKRLKYHKVLDKELDKLQVFTRRALAEIYRKHRCKRIAIFGHGNFIRALLTGILNADIIGFLSMEIFQSSISKIVIDRDGYIKIVYINNVSHLPEFLYKESATLFKNYEKK